MIAERCPIRKVQFREVSGWLGRDDRLERALLLMALFLPLLPSGQDEAFTQALLREPRASFRE
ncbi:hypothetical protein AA102526_1055 [Asaia lannensis NBRC 102526]|nr:hypothetical protein AA102526_1055 [Asaia lannensis NBRC 102526]